MRYICTQDLYMEKYDADGFLVENKYVHVPKDSVQEEDIKSYNLVGSKESVHLDRIWKSKKAKTHQWIEINKGTLLAYFKPMN